MEYVLDRAPASAAPAPAAARARPAPATRPRRHDLYALIHKALRLAMAEAMTRVGRLDTDEDGDVRAAAVAVRELIELCRMHLEKEEQFVHPALEAAIPGSAGRTARDHDDHLRAFDRLEAGVRAIERSTGERAAQAAHRLYRDLALFTAENLVHMHGEEVDNNAILWATLSDDEIVAIERRLVASIAPEKMGTVLRWMAPAMTPSERATFFSTLRAKLPPPAFAAVMSDVIALLDPAAKRKLLQALGA
ncbi:MAG TPA: hemerythrin domain-containing protein [Casimicrobiaceae bacterium]|nr:hemerythrin domain-containing protein [Casimicrobiaceae bacterium]